MSKLLNNIWNQLLILPRWTSEWIFRNHWFLSSQLRNLQCNRSPSPRSSRIEISCPCPAAPMAGSSCRDICHWSWQSLLCLKESPIQVFFIIVYLHRSVDILPKSLLGCLRDRRLAHSKCETLPRFLLGPIMAWRVFWFFKRCCMLHLDVTLILKF